MLNPRQLIGILALALASLGPIPSWLHHSTQHTGHCSHGVASTSASQSSCDAQHSHSHAANQTPEDSSNSQDSTKELANASDGQGVQLWTAQHDHDCLVCYVLGQSTNLAATTPLVESTLITREYLCDAEFQTSDVDFLHRPRGPPCC